MKELAIFLALDMDSGERALELVQKTKDYIKGYKIGPRLFLSYGQKLIQDIKSLSSAQVFLDFKFYDIPSSTLAAVRKSFEMGADFVTVHASAGRETLELLSQYEKEARQERFFQILCVTVLSSFPDSQENKNRAGELADLVYQSGLRGLVCSPLELKALRKKYSDMFLVSPGIRWEGDPLEDQKRVMTPVEAFQAGSSALVVGRSLLRSKNPEQQLRDLSHLLKQE